MSTITMVDCPLGRSCPSVSKHDIPKHRKNTAVYRNHLALSEVSTKRSKEQLTQNDVRFDNAQQELTNEDIEEAVTEFYDVKIKNFLLREKIRFEDSCYSNPEFFKEGTEITDYAKIRRASEQYIKKIESEIDAHSYSDIEDLMKEKLEMRIDGRKRLPNALLNKMFYSLSPTLQEKYSNTGDFVSSYTLSPKDVEEAIKRLEKSNKRLEKEGIEERYEYDLRDIVMRDIKTGALSQYVRLTVHNPRISHNGWDHLASIDALPSGKSVINVNRDYNDIATDLPQPDAHYCEHCGQSRKRTKSFLIMKPDTGEIKQIGSSCMKAFLGMSPKGLWSLDIDYELTEISNRPKKPERQYDTNTVLALAYILSDEGKNFVPSRESQSTSQLVCDAFGEIDISPDGEAMVLGGDDKLIKKALQLDGKKIEEIKEAVRSIGRENQYGINMNTLMEEDIISKKHLGLVVSALSIYNREKTRKAFNDSINNNWLAAPKEKIADKKAKVLSMRKYYTSYGGRSQENISMVMQTDDGHIVKWNTKASTLEELDIGDSIMIDRATVKGNSEFRGQKQTDISYTKFTKIIDES